MITVSNDFKVAMKQPVKEIQAYLDYGDGVIRDSDDLISYKISCDSGLCKTAMRKLEAKYLGSHNLLGKWVRAVYGVRLPDGSFEYLDYGSFLVTELTVTKDTETTDIVAYDKMVNTMIPYAKLDIEYPVSLIDYTRVLCDSCGVELGNVLGTSIVELNGLGEHILTNALETHPVDIIIEGMSEQGEEPTPTSPNYITSVNLVNVNVNGESDKMPLYLHELRSLPNGTCDVRSYGKDVQYVSSHTINANAGIWHVVEVRENTTLFYIRDVFNDMVETLNNVNVMCSHLPAKQIFSNDEIGVYAHGNEYKMIYFSVPKAIGTTVDELKAWFRNNQVMVQYEMAQPIVTKIDDAIIFVTGENTVTISANITPSSVSLKYYQQGANPFNPINDWQITAAKDADGNLVDLRENIEGITYRDIFVQIAQATGSTCIIGNDDKVYFKELADTGESLTYDNLFKLKLENVYGPINSVVLARTPSEDNIYLQDEESVQANGLTEFKIENNEIIDKDRENAITSIFNALNGVSYYPFEATTEGLGWYEIADRINIVNDVGEVFNTALFNFSITVDGSVKETLKTTAETKTQTQYQYATSIAKRVKNTEVIVNKQEQYIKQLVSDVYEENGVVNEKYTQIYQDIDNIINTVQNSGGNNLLKNSVMFAYDSQNEPAEWELEDNGEHTIQVDTESLNYGGVSGHSFTLLGKKATQRVQVNIGSTYTFSTKIRKNEAGTCYVKLYNTVDEHIIEIPSGESAYYDDYELKAITPTENYYIVEFYGSEDSGATFTDNMLALGEYKTQWTQANGEVMNTQVNININGVLVKSSIYAGSYTVMSPLEFAGYSNVNGTITRVFSLNGDITDVEKLRAKAEITMSPIKIIPITEGDWQGWAFVPSTEEV